METCSLYYGDREYGRVSWLKTETGFFVEARCNCELGMIYRVMLQTEKGLVPLGVMLPEGQEFVIRKEISSANTPLCAYIDRMRPGEQHLPGLPIALSAFSNTADGLLWAQWMDTMYLLFPIEPGKACAGAQFLSIATLRIHEGKCYGLFCKRKGQYLPCSDSLCEESMIR